MTLVLIVLMFPVLIFGIFCAMLVLVKFLNMISRWE